MSVFLEQHLAAFGFYKNGVPIGLSFFPRGFLFCRYAFFNVFDITSRLLRWRLRCSSGITYRRQGQRTKQYDPTPQSHPCLLFRFLPDTPIVHSPTSSSCTKVWRSSSSRGRELSSERG